MTATRTATDARPRWERGALIGGAVAIIAVALVLLARWLMGLAPVQSFLTTYPGTSSLPAGTSSGLPAWLNWQHGINAFFLLFIISSGLKVRSTKRPAAYFTRNNSGVLRTKGAPTRMSLTLWLHLSVNTVFILNGVVFYVLLFTTGQWARIVPTSWDIFPNAVSAALQYASFEWPAEHGWVAYNALQLMSYFIVVFVLGPVAILTGLRMSPVWPKSGPAVRLYPVPVARRVHFWNMVGFVAFIVVHVVLVFSTGVVANLNHMFAANDGGSWAGIAVFAAFAVVSGGLFALARPTVLASIAGLMGRVSR